MLKNFQLQKLESFAISNWLGNKPVAVKLAILCIFFIATLVGIVSYTVYTLDQQSADGTVIDIAGRQRMLTQKFTKELFDELNSDQVNSSKAKAAESKTRALFEVSLEALKTGGKTYRDLGMNKEVILPYAVTPEILKQLNIVSDLWQKMMASVDVVHYTKDHSSEEYQKHIALIRTLNIDVLKSMNKGVGMFATKSKANITNMIWNEVLILIASIIFISWLSFLVSRMISIPLRQAMHVANAIAEGDLSANITVKSTDETGQLLAAMSDLKNKLTEVIESDIQQIINSANHGNLQERINLEGKKGFYASLSSGINELVNVNGQVVNDTVKMFSAMANGDLTQRIENEYQGEFNQLKVDANKTVEKLLQVIELDIQNIIENANKGDLSGRIELDDKTGFYKSLSLNELVNVNEQVVNDTVRMFSAMEKGDLTQRITNHYQGDFNTLKQDANSTVSKLTEVIEGDVQALIDKAKSGDLRSRIDLQNKDGFYKALSQGINQLINVNDQVVNDTVRMFGAMAKGDLSQRITNHYQGDFNTLKQDANSTVDKLTEVIEGDIQSLINSAKNGDLTQRIALENKSGFFEVLSESVNDLVDVNEKFINDISHVMSAMADGDLTNSIDNEYQGIFEKLKQDTNNTVNKLTQTISNISTAASQVSLASHELAVGNNDLSSRTEQQACSLEETASSMEELASTVQSNSNRATHVDKLAKEAQKSAEQGGSVVSQAVNSMREISKSSKEIVDIINVIDEIAFQTNLLALNAAVEAARAGEQGRGFAVVASEVRNLAVRSAGAAKQIKGLINDSVDKVKDGTRLVNESGETLDKIVTSVTEVSNIITNIAEVSHEQTIGINQVNVTIAQMDQITQQNAALAEESTAASRSVAEQSSDMSNDIQFFNFEKQEA